MSATPVRRAGRFEVLESRQTVVWSVAEGRRGRRWRWVVSGPGERTVVHTLEIDPAGDFSRLESATAEALLTLHREPDRSVHGNRIDRLGVEPIAIEGAPSRVLVEGHDGVGLAALVSGLELAEAGQLRVLRIDGDLRLDDGVAAVAPVDRHTIRVGDRDVRLRDDGLPETAGPAWPLELDDEAG